MRLRRRMAHGGHMVRSASGCMHSRIAGQLCPSMELCSVSITTGTGAARRDHRASHAACGRCACSTSGRSRQSQRLKPNPSARVGKPLAHLQAQELDTGVAQFRGRRAAVALKAPPRSLASRARRSPLASSMACRSAPPMRSRPGIIDRCVAHCRLHAFASIKSSYASIARSKANSFADHAR